MSIIHVTNKYVKAPMPVTLATTNIYMPPAVLKIATIDHVSSNITIIFRCMYGVRRNRAK